MLRKRGLLLLLSPLVASGASGQSSVTLYGLLDIGIQFANNAQTSRNGSVLNGGRQFALADGHVSGLSGSRWGLRGSEDLGGGLKAIFVIENGFMANTGALAQGGAEFGRQVYAGMESRFGSVRLGRQYDPSASLSQILAFIRSDRSPHRIRPATRAVHLS